eukprot:15459406-Alexandrium_andersonii.AAC.1
MFLNYEAKSDAAVHGNGPIERLLVTIASLRSNIPRVPQVPPQVHEEGVLAVYLRCHQATIE